MPTNHRQRPVRGRGHIGPEKMLLAAFDVFVDRGIAAAAMEEIAQRAGVGKGTLYLYFDSKADMFNRLVFTEGAQHPSLVAFWLEEVMAPSLAALRRVRQAARPDHRLADLDDETIHHALVWPLIGGALHAQLLRSAPPRSMRRETSPRSHVRLVQALLQPVRRALRVGRLPRPARLPG
ncbi:helix-turn-helix domain-containing protein [uncultured Aquincola sp.]|uniref:TetR/AcrR family transcriptional regulator n=1 Tax=uncultured Aquincola sp. TaxID=886556 RepID=UPI0032B233D9